jgi:hypothetical protein
LTAERFPPDVDRVLREAGWFPGRDVGADFADWLATMEQELQDGGFPAQVFPALRSALAEFGGLRVEQDGPGVDIGRFSFAIGDIEPALEADDTREFIDLTGELTLGFGSTDDLRSELIMGETGTVYLFHIIGGLFHQADSMDEALVTLIRGIRGDEVPFDVPEPPSKPMGTNTDDALASAPADFLPATAGSLVCGNLVFSHTSVKGGAEPNLHPVLRGFFDSLPASAREPGAGRCSEAVLVSDRFWEMQEDWGDREIDPAWAREYFEYNKTSITTTRIRESGDPTRNTYQPPCRSCAAMLNHFGIEAHDVGC